VAPAPTFRQLFGRAPEVAAEARGRANLIGEHTDHSGGVVLPVPLPLSTRVELRPRSDRQVRVHSVQMGATVRFVLGAAATPTGWTRYVWAATQVAGQRPLSGFDARIDSSVPPGAGLASSAALLVALLRAFRAGFGWRLSDTRLALLAHRAESEFAGVPVGVMDPFVASLGRPGSALFLDAASLRTEHVTLPPDLGLAVLHSGVHHRLVEGRYRLRRLQCEAAARALGVPRLGVLSPRALPSVEDLSQPLDRRARHVLTENARVRKAVAALRAGDLALLGGLLDASHRSLRHDFQVSIPAVNTLVRLARKAPGVLGARMTGGGFGGAIVVLGRPEGLRPAMEEVIADYRRRVGRPGRVLLPE
jgi:galactokinase